MLELCSSSLEDTHAIAGSLAGLSRAGDIIVLSGEMGAGKTAFAQGFGSALGVSEPITSPTYTLVHSYDINRDAPAGHGPQSVTLHHADLYRLNSTTEVAELALEELAEYRGIVLVEWGDVVESLFGEHLVVHLEPDVDREEARTIDLSAAGQSWAARWGRLTDATREFAC